MEQTKKCQCGFKDCKCDISCKNLEECLGRWQCCGCKPCNCEPGSKCCTEKLCCKEMKKEKIEEKTEEKSGNKHHSHHHGEGKHEHH